MNSHSAEEQPEGESALRRRDSNLCGHGSQCKRPYSCHNSSGAGPSIFPERFLFLLVVSSAHLRILSPYMNIKAILYGVTISLQCGGKDHL